jgi:spermidine/putrescine transport system permease protein
VNVRSTPVALLLGPALLVTVLFFIGPMCIAIWDSFQTADIYGGVHPPTTFEAYRTILFERQLDGSYEWTSEYIEIVTRSVLLALITTIVCLIVATPVAWYIVCQLPRRRNQLLCLIAAPFFINTLIRTYSWVLLLRDTGLVNSFLQRTQITTAPLPFIYNNAAILLGLVSTFLPFMVLPIFATLVRMSPFMVEAALDLYATRLQAFLRVVVPMAAPGMLAGCAMVFAPALGSFLVPDLLGGGQHLLIGSLIQEQFTAARNWPFGAAFSIAVALLSLAVFTGARLMSGRSQNV